jgi:hypothetical protein
MFRGICRARLLTIPSAGKVEQVHRLAVQDFGSVFWLYMDEDGLGARQPRNHVNHRVLLVNAVR